MSIARVGLESGIRCRHGGIPKVVFEISRPTFGLKGIGRLNETVFDLFQII